MKDKIKIFTFVISLMMFLNLKAQIGGNQVYRKQSGNYNRTTVETKSIYSTDSTLVVKSKVLLNKSADFYIITIGVNSIAKTVVEANQITNKKIKKVTDKIKNLGIAKNDIYIDFVSETKMYDHTITDKEIKEYLDILVLEKTLS